MRDSVCLADIVRQAEALKGRKIMAQGKAQRRPGLVLRGIPQALKGRHNAGGQFAFGV